MDRTLARPAAQDRYTQLTCKHTCAPKVRRVFACNRTASGDKGRKGQGRKQHLPEGTGTGAGPRRGEGGLDKRSGSAERGEESEDTHGSLEWGRKGGGGGGGGRRSELGCGVVATRERGREHGARKAAGPAEREAGGGGRVIGQANATRLPRASRSKAAPKTEQIKYRSEPNGKREKDVV